MILIVFSILLSGCTNGELIIEDGAREVSLAVFGVDTLNPLKTESNSVSEIMSLVYDSLFTFDRTLNSEPMLAKEIIMSNNNHTAKIVLNSGIKWHSGAPFSAIDVIYTIDVIKQESKMYKDNVKDIVSYTVDTDGGIIVEFSCPQMNPEALFTFPVIRNGSSFEIETTPEGTGKYKLLDKTSNEITLVNSVNENSLITVEFLRNSQSCLNAFESRETDILTSSTVDLYENTPAGDIDVYEYTSNRMTFLGFNNKLSKYSDTYIRIAINALLDREKVIDEALLGKGTKTLLPINPVSSIYNITDGPEIDVDRTIEKAGYRKINGKFLKENGDSLSVTILVSQNDRKKMAVAENIRKQLETAGFLANTYLTDYDTYHKMIKNGDYDIFLGEVTMRDNLDPGFMTEGKNMFFYENQEISDSVYKMRTAKTEETLISSVSEYERIFSLNPPFVPLYYYKDAIITRDSISGITEPNFYNSLKNPDLIYFSSSSKKVNNDE